MEPVSVISIIGLIGLPLLGWYTKNINDKIVETNAAQDERLNKLEGKVNDLPKEYVLKDDLKSVMQDVKDTLNRIEHKLDGKADK